MTENQAGLTALITAYARGYHATHDDTKVFDDFLADAYYTPQEHAWFDQVLAENLKVYDPAAAAEIPNQAGALAWVMQEMYGPITLSRSRFCEDCLEQAARGGLEQYVILGAGLDTYAFRCPDRLKTLRVFELDHPITQALKRERVAAAGWEWPEQLTLAPIDFTNQSLAEVLLGAGYDPDRPGFFSWLGVTYYLSREVVAKTLEQVREIAAPGSSLVFDYLDEEAFRPEAAGVRINRMLETARQVGEPMKSAFNPARLSEELTATGWQVVENLAPEEIQARYFAGRKDRLRAFEHIHFTRVVRKD
jgi:methyltransferase (TIGR00027 family)